MSVSLSTKYQSITLYLFIILSACTSAFVPDTLAQEVLWSPAGFDAPPKVGAFDNTHERFHGGARELFQDEGVHGTVSAPKGNSALPQEEEAASSPKSSANDITVDQFTDEESALDGKLHVFAKLVERHIENTRAMCKDPEDKKLGSHPNALGPRASIDAENDTTRMENAVQAVKTSAEKGDRRAQFSLAFAFEQGIGVYKDPMQALQWYKKSAAQEYQAAIINLGIMYLRGTGVEKNAATAVEWFQKGADLGSSYAMHGLGALYRDGSGVKKDRTKALALFEKAQELGNSHATYSLGKLNGDMKNDSEAVYWYKKGAWTGDRDAQANLGVHYMSGRGVKKNPEVAVQWFLKSAEQGNSYAQLNIGIAYLYGRGVSKDATKAAHWFLKSAQQGNKQAQNNTSILYKKGVGVEVNSAKAVYWLAKAKHNPQTD